MTQTDKKPTTFPSEVQTDDPPSYTVLPESPSAEVRIAITPIEPPSASETRPLLGSPERIYFPPGPYSQDLTTLGPDSATVICPNCHYVVQTTVQSCMGTHAGYRHSPLNLIFRGIW